MPARRKAAAVATVLGLVPAALTALSAAPAAAHGSMGDPVSRVAQCYAEGPESPRSDACKAAVAAGGTQALYDWNGIRIGDADGRHQELIPDGRLCSAGNEEFKGLDLARADWPATGVRSGSYTFRYRVTAPHKGTFKVYLTKAGYDAARPLAWSDLDLEHPVATATDPVAAGGFYTFPGTLPERSGRQLLYAVWQRSDSPEAFYSCSDVVFAGPDQGAGTGSGSGSGQASGSGTAPSASAPSQEQIEDGAGKSTIEHHGHGDDDATTTTDPTSGPSATASAPGPSATAGSSSSAAPRAAGARTDSVGSLAQTGGDGGTPYLLVGGAAVLALGSALLFGSVRRRAAAGGRHGR
ncbi:lytic polysaccharide monooxygenase auxiliary activity family 9 protein [Streptomyces asoensis]|uniref:Chitin-binding protein n=1 Tax=Streptomyces asoensis TaxID=249586 RepID=A0ABQ3RTT5_9ACTN|nr:lytic polysaccharide monooxygenase [Streptomyces asoensis]GGQ94370.1 chitin-binding protein [Streptomyces asoensis]GHI59286.1 chitin-binding protein [Streptomyces asoensis]